MISMGEQVDRTSRCGELIDSFCPGGVSGQHDTTADSALWRFAYRDDDGAVVEFPTGHIDTAGGGVDLLQKRRTPGGRPDQVRRQCGRWGVAAANSGGGVVGVKRGIDGGDVVGVAIEHPGIAAAGIIFTDQIACAKSGFAVINANALLVVDNPAGADRTSTPALPS
jgi:hypothetical protein